MEGFILFFSHWSQLGKFVAVKLSHVCMFFNHVYVPSLIKTHDMMVSL